MKKETTEKVDKICRIFNLAMRLDEILRDDITEIRITTTKKEYKFTDMKVCDGVKDLGLKKMRDTAEKALEHVLYNEPKEQYPYSVKPMDDHGDI